MYLTQLSLFILSILCNCDYCYLKEMKIGLNVGEMVISVYNSLLTPTIKMILKLYVVRLK